MTVWMILAVLGLATAVGVGQPSARRLSVITGRPDTGRPDTGRSDTGRSDTSATVPGRHSSWGKSLAAPRGRRCAAVAAGVAVAVVVPSWWGLLGAGLIAGALDHWLACLPDRAELLQVEQAQRRLPLALELIAAALAAGAPIEAAVVLAAKGSGAPLSRPLLEVASSLRLGASADEAWSGARDDPVLQPLARLAVRSAASGAAMAQGCRDLAGRERQARVASAEAAIKRAGVMAVLPLALCYLPAFVLVGVVPIVVGLLSSLAL